MDTLRVTTTVEGAKLPTGGSRRKTAQVPPVFPWSLVSGSPIDLKVQLFIKIIVAKHWFLYFLIMGQDLHFERSLRWRKNQGEHG